MILLYKQLITLLLFFVSGSILFFSNGAIAAVAVSPAPAVVVGSNSSGGIWQVVLGLAVVLVAIGGAAWLIRRFVPGQIGAGGVLKMVGGMMVGPKERLVLVEIGETWLLLGVTAGQVNTLHSMPKPLDSDTSVETFNEHAFPVWLKRAMQRSKRDPIS